jgi:hypothetical protein
MSTHTKPSIVFVHGIWADGSSFSKLIPTLRAEGHEVIAAQYGLDTLAGDVAAVKRTLGRVSSSAILDNDRTVQPELQRFVAKRMGATVYEVDTSHVPMLSEPSFVIDVIRTAANAVSSAATRTA